MLQQLTLPSGTPIAIELVRHARARRYTLRVRPDRTVRVTLPWRGSNGFARDFAAKHLEWIERQLEKTRRQTPDPAPVPWTEGTLVWFRGERLPLARDGVHLLLGDIRVEAWEEIPDARRLVERRLRQVASIELPARVRSWAAQLGSEISRVSVRAQRSRWGSCSARKTISLNWRLIQCPALVVDYLIAHELTHLRHMNHSARFWNAVAESFPPWQEAEAWLKAHGREILPPR